MYLARFDTSEPVGNTATGGPPAPAETAFVSTCVLCVLVVFVVRTERAEVADALRDRVGPEAEKTSPA